VLSVLFLMAIVLSVLFRMAIVLSVLFLMAIVLSVLFRFTDSDYPFGIFKLFIKGDILLNMTVSLHIYAMIFQIPTEEQETANPSSCITNVYTTRTSFDIEITTT
jgi:hypothetical protein